MLQPLQETFGASDKINMHLPYDLATPLPSIHPEDMEPCVHRRAHTPMVMQTLLKPRMEGYFTNTPAGHHAASRAGRRVQGACAVGYPPHGTTCQTFLGGVLRDREDRSHGGYE